MDVRQLQYFIRVYEERSFSRAAEKSNVVQPALSVQIKRLEEELAASLFDRTPRGLDPTPAGHRLYERCVPIIRDLAGLRQEIAELVEGGRITGVVRVGIPPSVNRGVTGAVLCRYAEKYPEVEIVLTEAYSNMLTAMVREGSLDLALGAIPTENCGLSFRSALKDRLLLVTGRPLNGASLSPCRLQDLRNLKLILPSRHNLLGTALWDYVASGDIRPIQTMTVDGITANMAIAFQSEWAAIAPLIAMVNDLDRQDIYIYPIVDPPLRFNLHFVHDPRRPLTAASRAFVAMLDEAMRDVADRRAHLFFDELQPA